MRQGRESRARLREQVADAHQRLGEAEHAAEEALHRVAGQLPDPERVHRRASALSAHGDEHLHAAQRERTESETDGGRPAAHPVDGHSG